MSLEFFSPLLLSLLIFANTPELSCAHLGCDDADPHPTVERFVQRHTHDVGLRVCRLFTNISSNGLVSPVTRGTGEPPFRNLPVGTVIP